MNESPHEQPGPRITVAPHGPYVVSGSLPLSRRRAITSENGEPLTWQTTSALDGGDTYALCRCGGSANKPFCDGTHATNGFDGTESAPTSTYDERQRTYQGVGLVVRDDRSICEHAGFCGTQATNIWKLMRSDATAVTDARSQAIAMVERCPSGALTYRMEPDDDDIEPDLRPGVAAIADGPLSIQGVIDIVRSDGLPLESRTRMTLCRCGQSANKPLCDGSHRQAEFHDS